MTLWMRAAVQQFGSLEVWLKQMNSGNSLSLMVSFGQKKTDDGSIVDAEKAAKLKKGLDLSKDMKKALHILRKRNLKVEINVTEI